MSDHAGLDTVEWSPMAETESAWIGLETWECENELIVAPSRSLSLSLCEIVTSTRKWRPLECNQNYHRLEFDRNQHHMDCDQNYCQTSGQKASTKVWNVWTFSNFSLEHKISWHLQRCCFWNLLHGLLSAVGGFDSFSKEPIQHRWNGWVPFS